MDWAYPRNIYGTVVMCEAAARHGMAVADCLQGSGIRAEDLERPAATVRAEQELAVAANIVRALDDVPGLGLEVGALFHISAYGVLAFAMSSCANVRELIQVGVQYSSLAFSIAHKRFEEAEGEVRVYLDDAHVPEALRRFLIERDLAAFHNIQFELFSRALPLQRLELRHARPPYAEMYRERFGVDPSFGAGQNLLATSARILELPLPQANPHALRYWNAELTRLLDERRHLSGVAGKVRALLQTRPERLMDMDEVAARLHTTARNLRRQLDAEGTSYRSLVEELRQALAEKLLMHGHLSVEQIASRVGYQEPASFTSAFKRWKGLSPRAWREAQAPAARARGIEVR